MTVAFDASMAPCDAVTVAFDAAVAPCDAVTVAAGVRTVEAAPTVVMSSALVTLLTTLH